MLKIQLILFKIYSLSNYKTNLVNFIFKIKKQIKKKENYLYYLINNLNYKKKNKLSVILYMFIVKKYIKNIRKHKNYFFFYRKNVYLNIINQYYFTNTQLFFLFFIKIHCFFNLKTIKKIYTNILFKYKKKIYEDLLEKYVVTLLYIFVNNNNKIKNILKLNIKYIDQNLFYFLKNIKKICLLIYSNKEDFSNKIYLGMAKNNNNNINYYLHFLINNLIKKNIFKINVSIDIYNYDLLTIINNIKIFKKFKINLVVGIPDLFIEYLIKNKNWYIFDSNFVKKEYEFFIQSYYDEYIGYGSFRIIYKKILTNINIFKISINSKKLLINIIKNKIKIIHIDKMNRENLNKHISCLLPNFYHSKIFDRNNYFDKKLYYVKNANVIIKRNNNCYLEIKFNQLLFICKNNIKNFFFKFKIMDYKNNFLISQREINFHLNFRINPILFKTNYLNNISKNYLMYNLFKINSFLSKKSIPYLWYPGSDVYNCNYFYKNNYISKKWFNIILYIQKNKIKCSLNLNIIIKKKQITLFDNYLLKLILLFWQKKNEKY